MTQSDHKKRSASWREEAFAYGILLIVWIMLQVFLYFEAQEHAQSHLQKQISTQEIAWQAVQKIHKTGIESYFERIVNNPKVTQSLQLAQQPGSQAIARQDLYQTLLPFYQTLTKRGMDVLHFHTADNRSFLRFQQPDKYGDDLSKLRFSITQANKTLQPVHGFETGRVVSGFRHVYPIIIQGKHLGSVEISQAFEPLRREMALLDEQREYTLIQRADAIRHKSFAEFANLFTPSLYSTHWLEQDSKYQLQNTSPELSDTSLRVAEQVKQDVEVDALLNKGNSFSKSYRLKNRHYVTTFTAINDVKGNNSAYLVSTASAPELDGNYQQFLIYKILSTALVLLLILAIRHIIHSKRALAETGHYLESVNNAMSEGLYTTDIHGNITQINDAALHILGYQKEQLIHQNAHQLFYSPSNDIKGVSPLEQVIEAASSYEGELTFSHSSGTTLTVQVSSQPLNLHNKISGAVVAFHDVSRQKLYEETLKVAATTFETQNGIMITDNQGTILRVNQSFIRLTGYEADDVVGKNPSILSSGKQDKAFYQDMWQSLKNQYFWQGEIWNRRKDGSLYIEWLTITAVLDKNEKIMQYVANFSDVTERYHAQAKIEKLAFYDPLTQLPNRRLLWDRLEQALQKTKRSGQYGLLFFIDLDKFKTLNDSKGHLIGDLLLIQVAQLLKSCVRESDTVARIGGDEFIVLMEDLGHEMLEVSEYAEHIANNIIQAFGQDFILDGNVHHSSPSIGIELFDAKAQNADEVLMHADVAMYQAKQHGRNTVRFFSHEMQSQIDHLASMQTDLRKALSHNEFELYYQSQVNENSEIPSCEALIRWNHPQKGLIPPSEFIPLAEESGLIIALGEFVIEQACQQLAQWQQSESLSGIQVAVNVSAKQFAHADFVAHILKTLNTYQVDATLLKIELTESLVIENIEQTIDTMNQLRKLGIEFALDDFGTGHSSLSVIKHLPLSQVKIDQSFIKELGGENDYDNDSIVKTIIAMASTLKLNVIAEGVETLEQKQSLYDSGCRLYQGYLFSKPLPVTEFETLVETVFELHHD